ncbi:4'-phosphopantetheinyl transferase superfamily protein [Magnetospira sp. QH-2]|uniref:4'-phosphopantetheinyl transferase family protein n=1 Tax=Magnetospira sp. (strain QH-2) TaxID=1288970 RepID=UPI00130D5EE5|nr:4'-phosphopantetheinyl transferase superfamily protein [Magnetospira sp. QH-2]
MSREHKAIVQTQHRRTHPVGVSFTDHCAPLPESVGPLDGEVHVWSWSLDALTVSPMDDADLSPEERDHAARLHRAGDRRRYQSAHGFLRRVLAAYCGRPARDLAFSLGPHGKPRLAGTAAAGGLHFNLTHGASEVMVAVARHREPGVDVEAVAGIPDDFEKLAQAWFTEGEARDLQALSKDRRRQAFAAAWTRKEAVVKALGVGLSLEPDRVEVTIDPDQPIRLLSLDGDRHQADNWNIYHLEPSPGHVGALAVSGPPPRIVARRWIPPMASGDALRGGYHP